MAVGSGTGTPIEIVTLPFVDVYDPTEELDYIPNCAVSLPRYAKLVGYEEAAFWGVVYENQRYVGCGPLWTEAERMRIAHALAEAQLQVESVLGYPLCPTWVVGRVDEEYNYDNRWVDQQRLKSGRLLTRYPRLIAPGVRATTVLGSGVAVTHGPQVGTVGPIATTATDPWEIHVYYPGTSHRITPSRIQISGGAVTIQIPRYRLVIQEMLNTPEGGIMYENDTAFLETVDVLRVYNDPTTQAVLVRPGCANNQCSAGCSECTHSACIYVRDSHVGEVDVRPATWSGSEWTTDRICSTHYSIVRLNYLAGMRYLNTEAEMAVVKLAHTKLWGPPCGCDTLAKLWGADNTVPRVMTRERINNPFGPTEGAWVAYRWTKNQASVRARVF